MCTLRLSTPRHSDQCVITSPSTTLNEILRPSHEQHIECGTFYRANSLHFTASTSELCLYLSQSLRQMPQNKINLLPHSPDQMLYPINRTPPQRLPRIIPPNIASPRNRQRNHERRVTYHLRHRLDVLRGGFENLDVGVLH